MSNATPDINFQAPVPSLSVGNMVRMRGAAVERINQAIALLQEAADMAETAHIGFPRIEIMTNGSRVSGLPILDAEAGPALAQEIDRVAWSYLMGESGLRTFMDAEARSKWDEQLYKGAVPDLTAANVEATFRTMHDSRGDMFERGVLQCFRRLSWDYKTNKPFMFGKRIIINHLFSIYGSGRGRTMHINHRSNDELDDLVRVFHVLEGKPEPDHRNGIRQAIAEAQTRQAWACDTEYFGLKWFLKGSGHVTFKRLDLVERLNDILSKHYPGALAYERK